MLDRIRRASTGLVLATVVATGAVAATAGSASAAPRPAYVNDLVRGFAPQTNPDIPVTAFGLCQEAQWSYNQDVYGNPNGGGDQYYYCASRSDGGANLWWRHWV
ncbi:hypothetical protein [Streptomyces clavifer]|uniref:hypothetical protein n=1 Tax=Streptomyces clavifer TaxID=68188 RepID=UPI00380F85BF